MELHGKENATGWEGFTEQKTYQQNLKVGDTR